MISTSVYSVEYATQNLCFQCMVGFIEANENVIYLCGIAFIWRSNEIKMCTCVSFKFYPVHQIYTVALIKIYSNFLEIYCINRTETRCVLWHQAYPVENQIENLVLVI